jgi:hypothetical protein
LPKREKTSTAKKSVRHFAAGFRQPMSLTREERFQDLVSRQKALLNLRGELTLGSHLFSCCLLAAAHSANSRQGIADEHVNDSAAAIKSGNEYGAGGLFSNFADEARFFAARRFLQRLERGVRQLRRNDGDKLSFIRDMQRIETQ